MVRRRANKRATDVARRIAVKEPADEPGLAAILNKSPRQVCRSWVGAGLACSYRLARGRGERSLRSQPLPYNTDELDEQGAMGWAVVSLSSRENVHTVSDYRAWRKIYDDFAAIHKARGVTTQAVYQAADNPNDITVTHEFWLC
jgi:hypothetical protein